MERNHNRNIRQFVTPPQMRGPPPAEIHPLRTSAAGSLLGVRNPLCRIEEIMLCWRQSLLSVLKHLFQAFLSGVEGLPCLWMAFQGRLWGCTLPNFYETLHIMVTPPHTDRYMYMYPPPHNAKVLLSLRPCQLQTPCGFTFNAFSAKTFLLVSHVVQGISGVFVHVL